jgi:hypothetical protein
VSKLGRAFLVIAIAFVSTSAIALAAEEEPASQPATVDWRKLKDWLPTELAGLQRTQATGEKNRVGDFVMSTASATFQKDSDQENAPRLNLQVIDYTGAPAMAQGMAAWSMMQIDNESDAGYEKTTKVGGFPAMETFQNEGKHGNVMILVAGTMIVTIDTDGMSPEEMRQAAEALPLDKLAALK